MSEFSSQTYGTRVWGKVKMIVIPSLFIWNDLNEWKWNWARPIPKVFNTRNPRSLRQTLSIILPCHILVSMVFTILHGFVFFFLFSLFSFFYLFIFLPWLYYRIHPNCRSQCYFSQWNGFDFQKDIYIYCSKPFIPNETLTSIPIKIHNRAQTRALVHIMYIYSVYILYKQAVSNSSGFFSISVSLNL